MERWFGARLCWTDLVEVVGKNVLTLVLVLMGVSASAQDLRTIKPESVCPMPSEAVWAEYRALCDKEEGLSEAELTRLDELEEDPVLEDLYSGHCSWYCGGEVQRVTASSHLKAQGRFNYVAKNAHDFSHESVWAEGVQGHGVGEWLEYEFAGGCPRITHVCILNGHVKSQKAWQENSRVKRLKMYYMGKPYAILDLQDMRGLQRFDVTTPLASAGEDEEPFVALGYHDPDKPTWRLRFEIMEVYPGTKYEDTVISELYFDGIDVH